MSKLPVGDPDPAEKLGDLDLLSEAMWALHSCGCLRPDTCQGPAIEPDYLNDCTRCMTLARIRPRCHQHPELERQPRTRVRMPSGRHIDTLNGRLRFDDARSSAREALFYELDSGSKNPDLIEDMDSFPQWRVFYHAPGVTIYQLQGNNPAAG